MIERLTISDGTRVATGYGGVITVRQLLRCRWCGLPFFSNDKEEQRDLYRHVLTRHLPDFHRDVERDGLMELDAHVATIRLALELGLEGIPA